MGEIAPYEGSRYDYHEETEHGGAQVERITEDQEDLYRSFEEIPMVAGHELYIYRVTTMGETYHVAFWDKD